MVLLLEVLQERPCSCLDRLSLPQRLLIGDVWFALEMWNPRLLVWMLGQARQASDGLWSSSRPDQYLCHA